MNTDNELANPAFTLAEIEDVKIIIKAKGKHYSMIPKGDSEAAKILRIAFASVLLENHYIVDKALEDLKIQP